MVWEHMLCALLCDVDVFGNNFLYDKLVFHWSLDIHTMIHTMICLDIRMYIPRIIRISLNKQITTIIFTNT